MQPLRRAVLLLFNTRPKKIMMRSYMETDFQNPIWPVKIIGERPLTPLLIYGEKQGAIISLR